MRRDQPVLDLQVGQRLEVPVRSEHTKPSVQPHLASDRSLGVRICFVTDHLDALPLPGSIVSRYCDRWISTLLRMTARKCSDVARSLVASTAINR